MKDNFPVQDNSDIIKMHCILLQNYGPISITLGTKHSWVKRIQLQKGQTFFLEEIIEKQCETAFVWLLKQVFSPKH